MGAANAGALVIYTPGCHVSDDPCRDLKQARERVPGHRNILTVLSHTPLLKTRVGGVRLRRRSCRFHGGLREEGGLIYVEPLPAGCVTNVFALITGVDYQGDGWVHHHLRGGCTSRPLLFLRDGAFY